MSAPASSVALRAIWSTGESVSERSPEGLRSIMLGIPGLKLMDNSRVYVTNMAWESLPIELGEIIFQYATNRDLHMITTFSTVSKGFNAWNNLCFRLENCEETIQNFDFLQYMAKLERWDKEAEAELHHEECIQRCGGDHDCMADCCKEFGIYPLDLPVATSMFRELN